MLVWCLFEAEVEVGGSSSGTLSERRTSSRDGGVTSKEDVVA